MSYNEAPPDASLGSANTTGASSSEHETTDCYEQYAAWIDFNFARQSGSGTLDDRARNEMRDRAAEIIQSFRGEPNRKHCNKQELRWSRKGSFSLQIQGDKKGLWHEHENEIGGDIIKFIAMERGCSIAAAITYALDYLEANPLMQQNPSQQQRATEEDDSVRTKHAPHLARSGAAVRHAGRGLSQQSRHPCAR